MFAVRGSLWERCGDFATIVIIRPSRTPIVTNASPAEAGGLAHDTTLGLSVIWLEIFFAASAA